MRLDQWNNISQGLQNLGGSIAGSFLEKGYRKDAQNLIDKYLKSKEANNPEGINTQTKPTEIGKPKSDVLLPTRAKKIPTISDLNLSANPAENLLDLAKRAETMKAAVPTLQDLLRFY